MARATPHSASAPRLCPHVREPVHRLHQRCLGRRPPSLPRAREDESPPVRQHLVRRVEDVDAELRRVEQRPWVTGVEGGRVQLAEIFRFQQTGYDESGRVQGHFEPTGLVPEFYEKMRARGERVDLSIFDKPE